MTDISIASNPLVHRVERVRHDLKFRLLTVKAVTTLTPNMIRITFSGEDLAGFISAGFDDHVKLFFPADGEGPALPSLSPEGRPVFESGAPPIARDYTPRRFDAGTNELDIDFAIHEAGPATRWALQARPGDKLGIGGPRGSFVVADDFDWYLLIGDETALPAIGRRLEELRPGARAIVIAEISDAAEQQTFNSHASVEVRWLHRGTQPVGSTSLLDEAAKALALPSGDGYAWVACESGTAKRLRQILVDGLGHPKAWTKAAGYWKLGTANVHETHND